MRHALAVTKLTLKGWLRSKSGLFFSLLFPVMLLLIFGLVFGGGDGVTYTIYVDNNDLDEAGRPTEISQTLINVLNSTEVLKLKKIPREFDAMEKAGVLIIPKGFSDRFVNSTIVSQIRVVVKMTEYALLYGDESIPEGAKAEMLKEREMMVKFLNKTPAEGAVLTLLIDKSDRGAGVVKGILDNILASFSMQAIGASPVVELETRYVEGERGFTSVDYLLPGLIGAFIMTNGILGTAPIVSEYRRKGVIKRLAATPLTKMEWVLGSIITQAVMGFILTAVLISLGYAVFQVTAAPSPLGAVLIILGAVAFSGMGMAIAGALKDVEAVTGLANAVAFPMMFLSGAFWPLEMMPGFMQQFARILPLTYLAEGLRADLILKDPGLAVQSVAITLAAALIFITLGVAATRWGEE